MSFHGQTRGYERATITSIDEMRRPHSQLARFVSKTIAKGRLLMMIISAFVFVTRAPLPCFLQTAGEVRVYLTANMGSSSNVHGCASTH